MINVEITLVCTECGARSEIIEGRGIDGYEYHDSPYDAVCVPIPKDWAMDLDPFGDGPGFVLCPDHSHLRIEKINASREAWRKRVGGGVK